MNKIIPVCLPKLPLTEHIIPYLQQIDANRWYTNYGPLSREFLHRIANLFQLDTSQVISCSNGTMMLELCLKAMEIPKDSLCIMPSWTFIATPLAAVNANLQPYFVDVECKSQTLDPKQLEHDISNISQHGKIGAVIAVTPFGMPVNVKEWDEFTQRTGIPVVIDAAAGFDSALQMPEMQIGDTSMMISLHATKVMGVGEAAILLSKNEMLINQVECLTQFGFPKGVRNAESFGTNAKISEYTAAVGLAALDRWTHTRNEWKKVNDMYLKHFHDFGLEHSLNQDWMPSTCNLFIPHQVDLIAAKLQEHGIMTRKWYGDGCHQHSVFRQALCSDLTHTEFFANSLLGLPFYIGMSAQEIEKIVSLIAEEVPEKIYAT